METHKSRCNIRNTQIQPQCWNGLQKRQLYHPFHKRHDPKERGDVIRCKDSKVTTVHIIYIYIYLYIYLEPDGHQFINGWLSIR